MYKVCKRSSRKGPHIVLVGGIHGDETRSICELDDLIRMREIYGGSVQLVAGNPEALAVGKRYVDADLNRAFPGDPNSAVYEERLACELLRELAKCDFVLDVHTTTAKTPPLIITTRVDAEVIGFIQNIPFRHVIYMGQQLAKGGSLIDRVLGVSLEFCQGELPHTIQNVVGHILTNLGLCLGDRTEVEQEMYEVYSILRVGDLTGADHVDLQNMVETELNGERFYPVLFGERHYLGEGIVCLKARKNPDLGSSTINPYAPIRTLGK
ncbi:MAG: succinylglutamate desuccinylase/aspartoacylase family protein [Candidatus Woesearchaeota archaeon]